MSGPLTEDQVQTWKTDGFVAVASFLSDSEVAAAVAEARSHFPSPAEYEAAGEDKTALAHPCPTCAQPFVQRSMWFQFLPYAGPALNGLALGHRMISAVEQLLGTSDLRLTQSLLRATFGGPGTADQRLHRDFPANSLLVPSADEQFGQLPVLVYLTDVTIKDAPTYVVSNRYASDRPPSQVEADEDLYRHEVPNLVCAGTAMFYSMSTFHRGSAAPDHGAYRLVHHAAYRAAGHDWMDNMAWPPLFGSPAGQRCVEQLDPRQRELVGIPAPGHRYWTTESIESFAARYPGMDPEPYRAAL